MQDSIPNQILWHTKSLHKKNGRKTGGQPGHDGHFLKTSTAPDIIVRHHAGAVCECCGESLADITEEVVGKSQVIDIPPVTPVITEHVLMGKRCKCGHVNKCRASAIRAASHTTVA
jgi:transposase